jgi:hypothetical protein
MRGTVRLKPTIMTGTRFGRRCRKTRRVSDVPRARLASTMKALVRSPSGGGPYENRAIAIHDTAPSVGEEDDHLRRRIGDARGAKESDGEDDDEHDRNRIREIDRVVVTTASTRPDLPTREGSDRLGADGRE